MKVGDRVKVVRAIAVPSSRVGAEGVIKNDRYPWYDVSFSDGVWVPFHADELTLIEE